MDRQSWVVAVTLGSAHFAFHLFMRIVPPLIPILSTDLQSPLWQLGLLVSMFFAGSAIGLIPAGIISDMFDRRFILSLGLAIVGVGYILFATAASLSIPAITVGSYILTGEIFIMNIAMFIAGLGTSVHVPVGVPIITTNVTETYKGTVIGIWGGISKLGDAATPAIIGILILVYAWAEIVLAFGMLAILFAVILYWTLGMDRFDTSPKLADNTATETANGENDSLWDIDYRVYIYPMLVLVLYFALYQTAVQGVVAFTPVFIIDIYSYNFTFAGFEFSPESYANFALSVLLIAGGIGRFMGGIFVDRYSHTSVLVSSLLVASLGLFVITFVPLSSPLLLLVLVLFGGAFWGNSPARDTLISEMSPSRREGRTFGYLWAASRVFGAISPVLVGFIADTVGIEWGFALMAVAVFFAAIAISLLSSNRIYIDNS